MQIYGEWASKCGHTYVRKIETIFFLYLNNLIILLLFLAAKTVVVEAQWAHPNGAHAWIGDHENFFACLVRLARAPLRPNS